MAEDPSTQELRLRVEDLESELGKREETENALRVALEFSKKSFHESPVGMMIFNVDSGQCIAANLAMAETTGSSVEEILGWNLFTMDSWNDSGLLDGVGDALKTGMKKRMAASFTSPLGKEITFECQFAPLETEDERYLLISAFDVTGLMENEGELAPENSLLDNLIRSTTHVAIATADLDLRLSYFNPTAEKLFGLSSDDVVGRTVHDMDAFGPVRVKKLESVLETVRKEGQHTFSFSRATPDGLKYLEARIAGIFDSSKALVGYSCVVRDATQRKRSEDEKLNLERQLMQAQKMESLGVLAGGIANDFNNLLVGILGNTDLALDMLPKNSPVFDHLRGIEEASKKAAELVNQMLAYSGKSRLQKEPIKPNTLVEKTGKLLEVSISKNAVLEYNLAASLPSFDGDASQISQAVMNLVINASEAIGDQKGVIKLSTGAMDCDRQYLDEANEVLLASLGEPLPEGPYVFFDVTDTGPGMDPETAEKIFDPFFTTKFTGRGLGMSAVLGIVRSHMGSLMIDSAVGVGTTVRVLFPANQPVGVEGATDVVPGDRKVGWSERGTSLLAARGKEVDFTAGVVPVVPREEWKGKGTLLLADDEMAVLLVAKRMLERIGFKVLTAADGREALRVAREHSGRISGVLLDFVMPNMDGLETFNELRRLYPDLPVILCSGYVERQATEAFVGKGLAGFLQKPFKMADLRLLLSAVFKEVG